MLRYENKKKIKRHNPTLKKQKQKYNEMENKQQESENRKHQKTEGSIHKVAAKILGAESCNGWTYWHYESGKNLIPIDVLRNKLRPNS